MGTLDEILYLRELYFSAIRDLGRLLCRMPLYLENLLNPGKITPCGTALSGYKIFALS